MGFGRGLLPNVRLFRLWRFECQMYCWVFVFFFSWVLFVLLGVPWVLQKPPLLKPPFQRRKRVQDQHQKKMFWGTFLAAKKNFPGQWWIQEPYKNQGNHIYHQNLSSVAPNVSAKKKCSSLEQGGVCSLFPSFSWFLNLGTLDWSCS